MPRGAVALTPPDADWMRQAACVGWWELMQGPNEYYARQVCGGCPVRSQCREWVLSMSDGADPDGVVAGMTAPERKKYRRNSRRRVR